AIPRPTGPSRTSTSASCRRERVSARRPAAETRAIEPASGAEIGDEALVPDQESRADRRCGERAEVAAAPADGDRDGPGGGRAERHRRDSRRGARVLHAASARVPERVARGVVERGGEDRRTAGAELQAERIRRLWSDGRRRSEAGMEHHGTARALEAERPDG